VSTSDKNQAQLSINESSLHPIEGAMLSHWKIAPGDIFLKTPSGKHLRLKRAGDILEEAWKKKFGTTANLLWKPLINITAVENLKDLYQKWNLAEEPQEVDAQREEFISSLRSGMGPDGKMCMLDWAFTCYSLFPLEENIIQEFQAQHVVLYRRGLMVSSLAVLISIASGYEDPQFLKDIYLTGWLLDVGLLSEDFSYWVALACQAEKFSPGAGVILLKNKNAGSAEIELFLQHPRNGYNRVKEVFKSHYTFPELINSILHHHEKADGTGFPEGMTFSVMSDWQSLFVLADSMVDYQEEILENDLAQSFRELWDFYQTKQIENLPVKVVLSKIKIWFGISSRLEVAA
jgi:hypothetical protein